MENTFTYKPYDHQGTIYHLVTANEYPWINMQIITFPESEHDESINKLLSHTTVGWVIEHPERRDFAVIHVGGSGKLHFTQENYMEITSDMKKCMHNAARWWAETHECE